MILLFIITILIVAVVAVDYVLIYKDIIKCPKCEASLLDVVKIGKEVVGDDIHDSNLRIYHKIYKCKKCNYKYTIRTERSKSKDD